MRDNNNQLLSKFMKNYHILNRHQIKCDADPLITFKAIKELTYADLNGKMSMILGKLRVLILRIIFPKRKLENRRSHAHSPLDSQRAILDFRSDSSWGILGEIPHDELTVGFIGKFWHPTPDFVSFDKNPRDFQKFKENGYAKAVLDFYVKPIKNGQTLVTFETRVLALDYNSYKDMKVYWSIITPGIWFVRKMWLLAIKKRAEAMQPRNS